MDSNSLVVVKHNKVIEACYQLSLSEQRILLACIAQINSKSDLSDQYKFEVTVSQIEDLACIENAYRDVKEASEKLIKRVIKIENPDPNKPKLAYTLTHWVDSCDYYPSEGKVVLAFSRPIIPYLSQLSHNFTQYKIKNVAKMKSTYSIRLYELLCQWQSVGEREVNIDWLRKQWQLSDRYKRMSDLKKWVIDIAVSEINEHSNLWVKYGQRKSGRTITHLQFQFGLKDGNKPKSLERKQLTEEDINRQARPGETRSAVIARLTGSSLSDMAKPGETFDQALERKRKLAEVKKTLR